MHSHPSRYARASLPVLLAVSCLLLPAATSAHRRHLETAASPGGTLQQPTAESGSEPSHRDIEAPANCGLTLEALSTQTPPGLVGALSCPGSASVGAQTVTLYQRVRGESGFGILATTTTEADGTFKFTLPEAKNNSSFYVVCDGAKSARTRVEVALQVTIETPTAGTPLIAASRTRDAGTIAGGAVSFSGTVSPSDTGAKVALQRENLTGGGWHRIGVGEVDEEGKYSITHTFHKLGQINIRVVVRSHGLYAATISAPISYQVDPANSSG